MQRSTPPTEILLGFAAGAIVVLVVQEPLVWFLHHFGLTAWYGFSTWRTQPFGVQAVWSRVFWGGAFGIGLAWFGTRYALGTRYIVRPAVLIAGVRTLADWFIVPMFWGHAWAGWSGDALVVPLALNFVWAFVTAALLLAFTVAAGTWGTKTIG